MGGIALTGVDPTLGTEGQTGQQPATDQLAEHAEVRGSPSHSVVRVGDAVGHQPIGGLIHGCPGIGQTIPYGGEGIAGRRQIAVDRRDLSQ